MATQAPSPFKGTLKLATYPNRFNTVVPVEGPFYRTGLKLTSTGTNPRPLTEGLDYYLCYYFKEAAETLKDQVFGGIMLLTETEVNYTIYSVGREYRVPQSEIGKFLVSQDMKDPRNVDWSVLMRYAPVVAPIDPPANLDEAILRDEVVAALDNIRKGIIKRVSDMDASYAEVTDLIFQNGKKIFDDNMYQHHLVKNAHEYTAEEIGALKVLQKAVDSTKAFGKTIDELVDIMKTNGISQTHIDTLMPVVLGELRGRMRVLDNGALTFRTADSSHVITLQGDKFLITTTKPLNITADADNNDPGIAVEMTAGYNAMYVASGAQAPIFNGAYLITPDMVSLYLSAVKLQPANAYFQSTDTVKIYGNGKDYSPVNMSVSLPTADTTKPGLLLVTSISTNIAAGAAISQAAVTALKTTLDNYVDQTYTVNGKGFVITADKQELTLTAGDIGLGSINNTAPRLKPLTTAIINALKTKALATHTHTFADLTGVPTASDTVAGLVQLWDAIDTTTNKVVTSKQGYNVQQRINTLKNTVNQLLPAWTAGGSAFGNPGYLPIPVVGSYEGFARNVTEMQGVAKIEGDVVYALLNCHSGTLDTRRIFYAYGDVNLDNSVSNLKKLSFAYHPEVMNVKYPGVVLREIVISGVDGMVARGSDDNLYMITFNGTLNYRKHTTVCRIEFEDYVEDTTAAFVPNMQTDTMTYDGNVFYIMRAVITGNSGVPGIYRVGYYTFKASELSDNKVTAKQATVKYSRTAGKCADIVEPGSFLNEDSTTKKFAYYTPEGKAAWPRYTETTRGPNQHVTCQYQSGKVRIGANHRAVFFSMSVNKSFGLWTSAVDIDVSTGNLTLLTDYFPLIIDADGLYTRDRVLLQSTIKWNGRQSAYVAGMHFDSGDGRVVTYQASTEVARPMAIEVQALPQGVTFFDFLAMEYSGGKNSETFIPDGRGSVVGPGMSAPLFFPGTNKIWVNDILSNTCVEAEYDPSGTYGVPGFGGFGPTNNRITVPWATYSAAAQVPMVVNAQNPNGILDGAHFIGPDSLPYRGINGTTSFTADRLTITPANWAVLKQLVIDQAQPGSANGYASERIAEVAGAGTDLFSIDLWVVGTTQNDGPLVIAQVSTINFVTDRNYMSTYFYQLTPQISGGNISFVGVTLKSVGFRVNAYSLAYAMRQTSFEYGRNRRVGQPSLVTFDGSRYRLSLPFSNGVSLPSGTAAVNVALSLTKSGSSWTGSLAMLTGISYTVQTMQYETFVPELGCYVRATNAYDASLLTGQSLSAQDLITNTTVSLGDVALLGMKLAEGWNFYITESTTWRIGSTYYTAPAYSVDLKAAFPGNYQNRVFHVHVVLNGNTPEYQLLASKLADTDTRLYLGTITTDSSRIVGTDLKKVKRLGGLKQLVEHAGNVYEHDLDVPVDLKQSPLGLLKKEPLGNNITQSTYFDSSKTDLMLVNQKRSERRPTIKLIPTVFNPSDPNNRAAEFYPAPTATLATSGESATAASAGRSWIGVLLPATAANVLYTMRPLVTPTKNQLRVKLYIPAAAAGSQSTVTVNGTAVTVVHGNTATVTLAVTPGKRIAVEIVDTITSANRTTLGTKWFAFGIYDWDGTTETLLVASDTTTPFLYTAADNTFANMVLSAEAVELGVAAADYLAIATAGGCRFAPPILIQGTTAIVATKWTSHAGLEQAADLAINLMPKL